MNAGRGATLSTTWGVHPLGVPGLQPILQNQAKRGGILLAPIHQGTKHGIGLITYDDGPGIRDAAQAMQYGYSTRKGLGVGWPGAKWLMDDFDISTKVGKGSRVTMKKWLPCHE